MERATQAFYDLVQASEEAVQDGRHDGGEIRDRQVARLLDEARELIVCRGAEVRDIMRVSQGS